MFFLLFAANEIPKAHITITLTLALTVFKKETNKTSASVKATLIYKNYLDTTPNKFSDRLLLLAPKQGKYEKNTLSKSYKEKNYLSKYTKIYVCSLEKKSNGRRDAERRYSIFTVYVLKYPLVWLI